MVHEYQNLGFYADPTKITEVNSRNFGSKAEHAEKLMDLAARITKAESDRDTKDMVLCPTQEDIFITNEGVFIKKDGVDFRFTSKAFEGLSYNMTHYTKSFFKSAFSDGVNPDAYQLGRQFFKSLIQPEKKLFRLEMPSPYCSEPKVRTVLSENYNLLEETDLLHIMMQMESNWEKPVLHCSYSDNLTNITLGLADIEAVYAKEGEHFPAINFKDSQAGGRGVVCQALLHTVRCSNGLMAVRSAGKIKKTHRSKKEDILQDIIAKLPYLQSEARMVQDVYENSSKGRLVFDSPLKNHAAHALLNQEKNRFLRVLGKKELNNFLDQIVLPNPLIVSQADTLGYVVDYVTLRAQDFKTDTQYRMEKAAMDILMKYSDLDSDYNQKPITRIYKSAYPEKFLLKLEEKKEAEQKKALVIDLS
jgi:hypothetical protein